MDILKTITDLSHEFGSEKYVRGGGGNTSCKDENSLWVKPSGTTLASLTESSFVQIDRAKLSALYQIEPPADSSGREALVKNIMQEAVVPGSAGRPSVEAPLHDSLNATFVVHTHPALVNGLTCSKDGAAVCGKLFPDALWLDYIDPGYTLCMRVREEIERYKTSHGNEPKLIFLKNHGLFVSACVPEEIEELYGKVISALKAEYDAAGISTSLEIAPAPEAEKLMEAEKLIREAFADSGLCVTASGSFQYAEGPISPDHIVYSKSFPFTGRPSAVGIESFKSEKGYLPQVVAFDGMVFGVASNPKSAALALELAQDGALVMKLAAAFGGVEFLAESSREFIENWEVESYRKKQME
jgi:rhamnose utilization protein RhaD (predicted bifunctional aldolase and dehydrogenase)